MDETYVYYHNCSSDYDCPHNLVCYPCSLSWKPCISLQMDHDNDSHPPNSVCLCSTFYGHSGHLKNEENKEVLFDHCDAFSNGYMHLIIAMICSLFLLFRMGRIILDFGRLCKQKKLKINSATIAHFLTFVSFLCILAWQQLDASNIYFPSNFSNFVVETGRKQPINYTLLQTSLIFSCITFSMACLSLSALWMWIVHSAKYFKTIRRSSSQNGRGLHREGSFLISTNRLSESAKIMLKKYALIALITIAAQIILLSAFDILGKPEYILISSTPFFIMVAVSYRIGGLRLSNLLHVTERGRRESNAQATSHHERKRSNPSSFQTSAKMHDEISSPKKSSGSIIKILHTSENKLDIRKDSSNNEKVVPNSLATDSDKVRTMKSSSLKIRESKLETSKGSSDHLLPNFSLAVNHSDISGTPQKKLSFHDDPKKSTKLDTRASPIKTAVGDTTSNNNTNGNTIDGSTPEQVHENTKSENLVKWVDRVSNGVIASSIVTVIFIITSFVFIALGHKMFSPPGLLSPFPLITRLIPCGMVAALSFIESFFHNCMAIPALEAGSSSTQIEGNATQFHCGQRYRLSLTRSNDSSGDAGERYRSRTRSREIGISRRIETPASKINESFNSIQDYSNITPSYKRRTDFSTPVATSAETNEETITDVVENARNLQLV